MPKRERTQKQMHDIFLDRLRETCNVSEAARLAKLSRSGLYARRKTDPLFMAEWNEAEQEAVDRLEREAWRRAIEGVEKPVIYKGQVTGSYKEYSDRMLEFLLKAHRPDKFKAQVVREAVGKERKQEKEQQEHPSQRLRSMLEKMTLAVQSEAKR